MPRIQVARTEEKITKMSKSIRLPLIRRSFSTSTVHGGIMARLRKQHDLPRERILPPAVNESAGENLEEMDPDMSRMLRKLKQKRIVLVPRKLSQELKSVPIQLPTKKHKYPVSPLPAIENSAITGNQRLLQVAVIGQANSGKSSLFNRLASFHYATSTLGDNTDAFALRNGHRPCAASAVSGTTSHLSTIALTRHLPHQLILIDTPSMGSCKPLSLKGRNYKDLSWKAVERADHVLCVIDATGSNHQSKSGHLKPDVVLMLKNLRRAKKPSTLILNKVDSVKDTNSVVELMEQCNDIYRHFSNHFMTCSLPESAKQQSQYQSTITELHHHLLSETREQPWLYDSQVFSCDAKTSWVSECVREKFFRASTRRQLPFYVGFQVDIDVEGWTPLPDDSLRIDCRVTFESASTFVRYLLN